MEYLAQARIGGEWKTYTTCTTLFDALRFWEKQDLFLDMVWLTTGGDPPAHYAHHVPKEGQPKIECHIRVIHVES